MKVLCSCDSRYFLAFYRSFFSSAVEAGYEPIINVINPTPDVIRIVNTLWERKERCFNYGKIEYTFTDRCDLTFYASNRYYIAEKYLFSDGLLITDIDMIFLRKLPRIHEDVGLYFRDKAGIDDSKWDLVLGEYDEKGRLIAGQPAYLINCSLLWFSGSLQSKLFLKRYVERIKKQAQLWFADQKALFKTYMDLQDDVSTYYFNKQHMFWRNEDARKDSYICSGKGDTRFANHYKKYKDFFDKRGGIFFGSIMNEKENVVVKAEGEI